MVGVYVNLRDVSLFATVLYGEWMKTKNLRQHSAGLFIRLREVYSYEPVLAREQGFQVLNSMPLNPRGEIQYTFILPYLLKRSVFISALLTFS